MASQKVGDIYVEVSAQTDKLNQGLKDAEQQADQSADRIGQSADRVRGKFAEQAEEFQAGVARQVGAITGLIGSLTAVIGTATVFYNTGKRIGEAMFGAAEQTRKFAAALDETFADRQGTRLEELNQKITEVREALADAVAALNTPSTGAVFGAAVDILELQRARVEELRRSLASLEAERFRVVEGPEVTELDRYFEALRRGEEELRQRRQDAFDQQAATAYAQIRAEAELARELAAANAKAEAAERERLAEEAHQKELRRIQEQADQRRRLNEEIANAGNAGAGFGGSDSRAVEILRNIEQKLGTPVRGGG